MQNLHERAQLLISQGRYDMAEQEIGQILAKDPNDAIAHLLLALCFKLTKRYKEATTEAQRSIQLQPDNPRCHLILSSISLLRNRYDEAEASALEALRLDPYDEDVYTELSKIHLELKNFDKSLEFAEKGLEIDPDNSPCLSLRSFALERLGKTDVAVEASRESLSRNPDDSYAHASHGWALLTDGKHKEAQESFREALRLDPTNDFAKQGMIKAMNANNLLFRMILAWYNFMGRMGNKIQWIIVLGLFFGNRILGQLAATYPAIQPFIYPLIFLYVAFCVTTWIANPVFNTFLRFNRYGKYLLDKDQIRSSNAMGGMMLLGLLLGCGLAFVLDEMRLAGFAIGLGYAVFMLLPLSSLFNCEKGYPFIIMLIVTVLLGLWGLLCVGIFFTGDAPKAFMVNIFIYGSVASQFLAIYLVSVKPKI